MADLRRTSLVPQILLALAAGASLYIALTLPARSTRLSPGTADPLVVFGGYHVHTNRSDGTGSPDDVAAAAARAGLQFVILTDHGDATRPPDPPRYHNGVLVVDAVEISTTAGHLVALGLRGPAPFPLAGEPRDVIEDVHRLGAWAVIAHPDSPKPDLRWRNWNVEYDGIEWLNVDSEWRDESASHLAGTFARYLVRPPETIASLFRRPAATLRRWDAAARYGAVTGLAALDAHARLAWRTSPAGPASQEGTLPGVPGYRQMFRTLSQAVILDRAFSGDPAGDAGALLAAMRRGRTYSIVTAFAAPGRLAFTATANDDTVQMGDFVGPLGSRASFHAEVNDVTARIMLVHAGTTVASSNRGQLDVATPVTAGPYRVEVYRAGKSVPWIVSNPIYGGTAFETPSRPAPPPPPRRLVTLPALGDWSIEHSADVGGRLRARGWDDALHLHARPRRSARISSPP